MKKTILTLMIFNLMFFAIAQEEETATLLVSKKGFPILPESGDFSLGISAVPFLEYAGNAFNGATNNNSPGFYFTQEHPLMITGKYMLDENTAIRGIFRAGFGNFKTIGDVTDDVAATFTMIEDTYTESYTSVMLIMN